jgi:seryl-tRNA synthetase
VTGQSYVLGLLVYAFKTPVGIVCLIIIPCLIIIAFEVMRLVKVFGKDKKEKLQAEKKKQDDEIEELKRQLAELQNMKNDTVPVEVPETPPTEIKEDVLHGETTDTTTDTTVVESEPIIENTENNKPVEGEE